MELTEKEKELIKHYRLSDSFGRFYLLKSAKAFSAVCQQPKMEGEIWQPFRKKSRNVSVRN